MSTAREAEAASRVILAIQSNTTGSALASRLIQALTDRVWLARIDVLARVVRVSTARIPCGPRRASARIGSGVASIGRRDVGMPVVWRSVTG